MKNSFSGDSNSKIDRKGVFILEKTENIENKEKIENQIVGPSFEENVEYIKRTLNVATNFDIVYRVIQIGSRRGCIFFIDGFCKDELMQKVLQYLMDLKEEKESEDAYGMIKKAVPYVEVDKTKEWKDIIYFVMAGVFGLLVEGYEECILIDSRTYPARSVSEPEKDKTLRGSKDGFVETIIFNTALIRRRIRDTNLCMEMLNVGRASKTDVVLCYMSDRVNQEFLTDLRERINRIQVDALTMNQESLAECIYHGRWYNPFPKFKFTERPDTAAAQVLEGNIIVLVDNSPQAMITPTSVFDILEEADDYYFPPVTGTYLRLSRILISFLTYFITPLFLLMIQNPEWIPEMFHFILLKEPSNIPVIWQFLILELSIDGLRLAAVNTPNMLSTPLSILAALVLGEFSVNSGWFNAEVMLYMAFVAIASYTQANYEFGYALKFMRVITLILTSLFQIWGFIAGVLFTVITIAANKTVAHQGYLYPLIPFDGKKLSRQIFRHRLRSEER